MKKRRLWWVIIFLGLIIVSCKSNPYLDDQKQLAKTLGVKIEDYPYQTYFPIGYFGEVLKPGISIKEVHEVVTGYDKSFRCGEVREVYYFFSSEDDEALRIKVIFDKNLKFQNLLGEDENSSNMNMDGCQEGLLNDK